MNLPSLHRPKLARMAFCLAITASVAMPVAHAYEIEATATSTLSSVFPSVTRDRQVSQSLLTVSAAQSGPDPVFGNLNSFSSADLATGSLHGFATVTNSNTSFLPGLVAEAGARIDETLNLFLLPGFPPVTITLPPGIPAGSIPVDLVLHARGSFANLTGAGNAYGVFYLSSPGSPSGLGDYMTVSCSNPCSAAQIGFNPLHITTLSTAPGAWAADLSLGYFVDPALPFNLHAEMSAQASSFGIGAATLDASNTASIEVKLPTSYGFTSSSGVFLTEVSPVPEPAAALLMSAGLLVLVGPVLRKRAAQKMPPRRNLN